MPSLKEIKGRIASVKSTLKITSAMKLVASAKLRKAQQAIEGMRPYERKLQEMLAHLTRQAGGFGVVLSSASLRDPIRAYAPESTTPEPEPEVSKKVAIVAFASNSSLCGAFNANAVRLALETIQSFGDAQVMVYSVGRKMAEAMKKVGYPSPADYQHLADKPSYAEAAVLAEQLMEDFREGRVDRVELVYNHFVSSGKQVPVRETFLPFTAVISGEAAGEVEKSHVRLRGLMGMATNTEDEGVIERDFARIEALFHRIREEHPELADTFTELSIGMSGDWPIAVRHGATMVRIGTDIFGPREY